MSDFDKNVKLMEEALSKSEQIQKSFTQNSNPTQGFQGYNLEAGMNEQYAVITPLLKEIPRSVNGFSSAVSWKNITGVNTALLEAGVPEGKRGGVVSTSMEDKSAAYKTIGLEDTVTDEAYNAGKNYIDLYARAATGLLHSVQMAEEKVLLGGNSSLALGTTPTPSLSASGTGGTLPAATLSVICVALSHAGSQTATVSGGVRSAVSTTTVTGGTITHGGGAAEKSAAATVSVSAGNKVAASVAAVKAAFAYAWFYGAAGAEVLGAITRLNSVLIADPATGTQTAASLPAADNSRNSLVFDGLMTQALVNGSGAYYKELATGVAGTGTPLTAGGDMSIVEIDEMLLSMWENFRTSPDTLWGSARTIKAIRGLLMTGGANSVNRIMIDMDQKALRAGGQVLSYLNPFGMAAGAGAYEQGQEILIKTHPNMPDGVLFATSKRTPFNMNGKTQTAELDVRQGYKLTEWARRERQTEFGIYVDEVLKVYFTPGFGIIKNIAV